MSSESQPIAEQGSRFREKAMATFTAFKNQVGREPVVPEPDQKPPEKTVANEQLPLTSRDLHDPGSSGSSYSDPFVDSDFINTADVDLGDKRRPSTILGSSLLNRITRSEPTQSDSGIGPSLDSSGESMDEEPKKSKKEEKKLQEEQAEYERKARMAQKVANFRRETDLPGGMTLQQWEDQNGRPNFFADPDKIRRKFDQIGHHTGITDGDRDLLATLEAVRSMAPNDPHYTAVHEALRQRLEALEEANTIRIGERVIFTPQENPLNRLRQRRDKSRDNKLGKYDFRANSERTLRNELAAIVGEGKNVQARNEAIDEEILRIRRERGLSHRDLVLAAILANMFEKSAARLDETYSIHDRLYQELNDKIRNYTGLKGIVTRVGDLFRRRNQDEELLPEIGLSSRPRTELERRISENEGKGIRSYSEWVKSATKHDLINQVAGSEKNMNVLLQKNFITNRWGVFLPGPALEQYKSKLFGQRVPIDAQGVNNKVFPPKLGYTDQDDQILKTLIAAAHGRRDFDWGTYRPIMDRLLSLRVANDNLLRARLNNSQDEKTNRERVEAVMAFRKKVQPIAGKVEAANAHLQTVINQERRAQSERERIIIAQAELDLAEQKMRDIMKARAEAEEKLRLIAEEKKRRQGNRP